MGPKLLFVMGILVAHGALGAAWLQQDAPKHRSPVAVCVNTPGALPDFTPARELYAINLPVIYEERVQP